MQKSKAHNIFSCFLCKNKKAHIICIFIEKILNPEHYENWWSTNLFFKENRDFEDILIDKLKNRFFIEIHRICDKLTLERENISNCLEVRNFEKDKNYFEEADKLNKNNEDMQNKHKESNFKTIFQRNDVGIAGPTQKNQISDDENYKTILLEIFGLSEYNGTHKNIESSMYHGGKIEFICGDHNFEEKCFCGREEDSDDMIACDYCSNE